MNVDDVEEEFNRRLANIAINQCCCLVYTVREKLFPVRTNAAKSVQHHG